MTAGNSPDGSFKWKLEDTCLVVRILEEIDHVSEGNTVGFTTHFVRKVKDEGLQGIKQGIM